MNAQLAALRAALAEDGDYVLSGERTGIFRPDKRRCRGRAAGLCALDWFRRTRQRWSMPIAAPVFLRRELAARFARVIGIEENERAVEYARRIAGPNESYVAGDVAIRLGECSLRPAQPRPA